MADSMSELIKQDLNNPELSKGFSLENRAILEEAAASGRITQAMYDEAALRYQSCLGSLGNDVKWVKQQDGTYRAVPQIDNQAEMDKYSNDSGVCAYDGFSTIESLFCVQQNNPGLYSDQYEAVYQCLKGRDVPLPGLALEDFRSQIDTWLQTGTIPADLDFSDPDIQTCLSGNGFGLAYSD